MRQKLRVAWRLPAVGLWLVVGGLLALPLLRVNAHQAYSPLQLRLIRWWSHRLLAILGVRLSVHGQVQDAPVWVANHISWLDIIVLMTVAPSRFLSKAEVAHWPLIGWLARRAGTVFIRRGHGDSQLVVEQLKQLVSVGERVLFFPEGTSTAGEPQRFHARLFSLPLSLDAAVAPVALIYHDHQVGLRADLAYIGEQTFMQSLLHLLAQQQLVAAVSLLPAIDSQSLTRNVLAQMAETSVRHAWQAMRQSKTRLNAMSCR
jgi:1-acyl-sn-glycerol-3-phosphate acyltransferase